MDAAIYDELEQAVKAVGPAGAIDRLCVTLRERKEYSSFFYALLMKKRHELGVSPLPTAPSSDLPESVHESYENAIRDAARLAGQLYLDEGDILRGAPFFRMIGEVGPVQSALDKYQPADGEDVQPIIELAFHNGGHPRKGFDLVLDRFGICSAITMIGQATSSPEFPYGTEVRDYCVQRLVRALHEQLIERIRNDIVRREGSVDGSLTVPQLIEGRDWLFEDDNYHVDVSHLASVVQMSIHLSRSPELTMAREMCAYGQKLSSRFQYAGDPPFEDQYRDYGVYLAIVDGEDVDAGLAHFKAKLENPDPDGVYTQPAEMVVNLLLRIGRPEEALDVARRQLEGADERSLSCPGITELCRRVNDYRTLAEVSRQRGDPVNFVAGLILANGK